MYFCSGHDHQGVMIYGLGMWSQWLSGYKVVDISSSPFPIKVITIIVMIYADNIKNVHLCTKCPRVLSALIPETGHD